MRDFLCADGRLPDGSNRTNRLYLQKGTATFIFFKVSHFTHVLDDKIILIMLI